MAKELVILGLQRWLDSQGYSLLFQLTALTEDPSLVPSTTRLLTASVLRDPKPSSDLRRYQACTQYIYIYAGKTLKHTK